ncbi:hypothetical protein AtubIFM55763_009251 [Aspergillus tubingensis]|nr:hypothetical protein AtubIFM55763_009251 [Aspergillus tubingensis]
MPRTDEADHFINAVYSAVQEIPRGRVTTYGHIATLLGYRSAERQAEALRGEGVEVEEDSMGEWYVDFGRYGWFPDVLPSEISDDEGGS